MVNKTQSLPSQSLHVSDDDHDPRPTELLLGQCLPNLAAPPSGPGQGQPASLDGFHPESMSPQSHLFL